MLKMKTTFVINGITCSGCVAKLTSIFSKLEGVNEVLIDKDLGQVTLVSSEKLDRELISKAIKPFPKYTLAADHRSNTASSIAAFKPLIVVLVFILLLVLMSQLVKGAFDWMESMRLFMAGFFIAFSFFKFLDLKGFAQAYQSYDIIARVFTSWGYIYPFIELSLGIFFLFNLIPFYANLITLVVLGISSIGVIRSVLAKSEIKCACLGTGFNLPMTTVTIIEDLSMVVMSVIMLFSI